MGKTNRVGGFSPPQVTKNTPGMSKLKRKHINFPNSKNNVGFNDHLSNFPIKQPLTASSFRKLSFNNSRHHGFTMVFCCWGFPDDGQSVNRKIQICVGRSVYHFRVGFTSPFLVSRSYDSWKPACFQFHQLL